MTSPEELIRLQHTIYDSKNPTRRWLHQQRKIWILEAIDRFSKPDGIAIEIGPGSGVYLPKLAKCSSSVVALDLEAAYLQQSENIAKDLPNLTVVADDITASNLQSNYFDLVLCTEVIEHIADSQSALNEIQRILKPDGVAIITTPQKYSPLEMAGKIAFLPGVIDLVRLIYQEPILDTGHINLMTENEVLRQMSAAQLVVHENFKSGMYLPIIAEFLDKRGLSLEKWLEKKLQGSVLDGLLWTQYYIVRKLV